MSYPTKEDLLHTNKVQAEVIDSLKAQLEAAQKDKEHWYNKFTKLEGERAMCCWENEKLADRYKAALERIAKVGQYDAPADWYFNEAIEALGGAEDK